MRAVWGFSGVAALGCAWLVSVALPPATGARSLARTAGILASAAERPDAVVFGDSITHESDLTGVCGATLNAGVGGASIEDFRRFALAVLNIAQPKVAVFALGTNNAAEREITPAAAADLLREYIDATDAERVIIVGPWPVDKAKPPHGARFDQGYIDRLNAEYRRVATDYGVTYIEPPAAPMTRDGVHPNAGGVSLWRENLRRACAS